MVKIMLASHGNLAAGMLSSAEMVFGKQDNVCLLYTSDAADEL